MILVLLPIILNPEIGDDITHRDDYKHNYTEVVKGLSMVLLQCSPSSKWEQAGMVCVYVCSVCVLVKWLEHLK